MKELLIVNNDWQSGFLQSKDLAKQERLDRILKSVELMKEYSEETSSKLSDNASDLALQLSLTLGISKQTVAKKIS